MSPNPAADAALAVPCPTCKAKPGEPCRSPKAYHVPRAQRGLNWARTHEFRQHERAERARGRVAQAVDAGRKPDGYDITLGVGGCCCSDVDCTLDGALRFYASIPAALR